MNEYFRERVDGNLVWLPELGVGYYPVQESPYDAAYFEKYQSYAQTEMGRKLTQARVDLVRRHWWGLVLDVGIGSGSFVEACSHPAYGFDVNPAAVEWLSSRDLWMDPYASQVPCMTFWDSLEHIHNPQPILANIAHMAFVSLPIFTGSEHILRSKHFRKDEHCWYWTRSGFLRFMADNGFEVVERNAMEQELGREDIETFAFRRVK
jgi:hypothetical protein